MRLAEAFQTACIWECMARKVGNVHRHADFDDTGLSDFLVSGAVAARAFDAAAVHPVGLTVELAARATHEAVGRNTNLGILLLIAPLAAAPRTTDLQAAVGEVLTGLTVEDAARVYHAIRLANPGGLGDAPEQDVKSSPTVSLLDAMKLAADRDTIAQQYANNFANVFDLGVPAFLSSFKKFQCVEAAIIDCHLRWMSTFPDSLIARKCGLSVAADVQRRAIDVLARGLHSPDGRRAGRELDAHLRSDGHKRNPGTSADLVAASLFVALREDKVKPSALFRWSIPDWL